MATAVVERADEGVVASVGAKDFSEAAMDVAEGAAGVGDVAGVMAIMVGAEVAEANAEETPFLPSKILFNHRIFSSILDIEAQRSVPSTMAQFNFGEKF